MVWLEVDWTHGEEHMRVRHGVTAVEANGASAWRSNATDIRRYAEGDES